MTFRIGRKAAGILIYCLVAAIFFEGTARLFLSLDPLFDLIKGNDDASMRIKWTNRHQNQKEISYKSDIYDPTKGWTLRPGLQHVTLGGEKFLNSNSKGLRGKVEYSYEKPPDKTRILIFGDSLTFGEGVSDTETYSYYLQEMLPSAEVLNFGVHGYGHDQMLIYLKEEAAKYSPDIVILGFVYLDMRRNMLEFRDYAKPRFELVNDRLKLKNVPVPPPELTLEKEFYRSKALDLFTMLHQRLLWTFGSEPRRTEEITTAILDEMITTIRSIGATPVFAYLPVREEVESEEVTPGEKYFLSYCRGKQLRYPSLRPYFVRRVKSGDNLKTNGHWNATGHRLVAEGIREYLLETKLIIDERLNRESAQ